MFEQLKPSTLKSFNPEQQFRLCDLRILDTTCKDGWRTTHRLVVSSFACEKQPWCTEMFLPLSNVGIRRKGTALAAIISLKSEQFAFNFMSALTPDHELIFSRRANRVATRAPSKWRATKSSKGPARVLLWRKDGMETRLLARWENTVHDKWLGLQVERDALLPAEE
ncbi:MAG: hypothetical protein L6R35_004283 [Caloplaca aegaea]|nr:MAG: hypothetical protein L6R35_004283 [Caloplaca aegaea]